MSVPDYNFTVRRGDKYRVIGWRFPFDLTGSTIQFIARSRGQLVLSLSTPSGLVVENATINGSSVPVVWWDATAEQTALIAIGGLTRYEVKRNQAGGELRTYVEGIITGEGGLIVV